MTLEKFEIKDRDRIITLNKDRTKISLPNLSMRITYDYALLSTPSIFGDFGSSFIDIDDFYFDIVTSSSFNGT
jgi:hypothetical protein